MNRSTRMATLLALSLVLALSLTACASFSKQSGFLDGYYKNLQPGPEGGVKERWLKPGVDFSKYDKVMLDGVVFYFAPDSDDKGIDPEQMKELSDAFNRELVNALKDKYPIVVDSGPGVLRVKIALTGIRQSRPVLSGVTSIVPVGIVISSVKRVSTGAWTGSGATRGELMLIDTDTSDVVGVAVDEQSAGFTERFSKYGSAEEAFKFWAGRMVVFLNQAHGVKEK